jgi:hypothetical protein
LRVPQRSTPRSHTSPIDGPAAGITDPGEEHGHRVLRVRGEGGKIVLGPLPPAAARAIDRAVDGRTEGPILRNTLGVRMDRHAATRWLKHLPGRVWGGHFGEAVGLLDEVKAPRLLATIVSAWGSPDRSAC